MCLSTYLADFYQVESCIFEDYRREKEILIPGDESIGGISAICRSGTMLFWKMSLLVGPYCFRGLVNLLGSVHMPEDLLSNRMPCGAHPHQP